MAIKVRKSEPNDDPIRKAIRDHQRQAIIDEYPQAPSLAEVMAAKAMIENMLNRGRPSSGKALLSTPRKGRPSSGKKVVSLRLDPDIIEAFRATGPGWQARINEALRKVKP